MKKTLIIAAILVIAVIGLGAWITSSDKPKPSAPVGDVVSKDSIHWHPHLTIYIKGQKQEIPANIGIGKQYASSKWYDSMMQMTDVHTHDASGTLHWEVMDGPVAKDHVRLGVFFEIWGKPFNATQILDSKNGPDGMVKMTVNDQPNTEFENYQVKDKDDIVIRYE